MSVKSISQMPMHPTGMGSLKDSLSRQLHADGNPWDDGPLPDLTSGVMWTATGLLGAAVLVLPGIERDPRGDRARMAAFAVGWGLFSLWMASRGRGMTVGWRALVTATTMPIVAALAVGHRRRHELPPAGDDLHRPVHLLLLPAATRLAAERPVHLRVRHAALLRRPGDRGRLPGAARDVRARHGRRDGRDPLPEGPPGARRAVPAHDGRVRLAHRREQPARVRRRARARRAHARALRADPDRPRRLQADQRRAGPPGR